MRTSITCCIVTPVLSVYFFSMQYILSGHSLSSTWEHLQQTLPQSWKSAFRYWPIVNAINFSVVPTQFRGIFQAFSGLVWQTYLAWMNRHIMDLEKSKDGQCQGTEESIVMKSQGRMPVEC
ncbi:Mpv17/PMP22 family protein [Diaporthe eres]|nr:Mpv17/PMP22 family protein [Diaporthe eres]